MIEESEFHLLTVGWDCNLVEQLANRVAEKSAIRISHVAHPKYTTENWPQEQQQPGIHFLREKPGLEMPQADQEFLGLLPREGVPTVHNMILGDRVVSKLPYADALRYATYLGRRLTAVYAEIRPDVIIVAFDAIHSGMALAIARQMGISVYALHFSVIPPGLACFCDELSPAARVTMRSLPDHFLQSLADESLKKFEEGQVKAHAYIAPKPLSPIRKIARVPGRLNAIWRTRRKARMREYLKYTEGRSANSVTAAVGLLFRAARCRRAISRTQTLYQPPETPFVLFGLHLQPESSIDVWAPFFSNQMWVIELLSRSIPPTHRLLVKIHKSDVSNYSAKQLQFIQQFPGVDIVAPSADSRAFLEKADLLIAIQGTLGLEAALLGKPVIMLGNSPVTIFPSASQAGAIQDLPQLVISKLAGHRSDRAEIVRAYVEFLRPFYSASHNDWSRRVTDTEIDGYVEMFDSLRNYLTSAETWQSVKHCL